MEIEAKYRVTDRRVFAELLQMSMLGTFRLIPHAGIEYQHNTYYETPDNLLTRQQMSLRIRRTGTAHLATLKRSRGVVGAIHTRDELEAVIGSEVQPIFWKPSVLRERVLQIIGTATLIELFTIQNRRQRIDVVQGDMVIAELSLDEGVIQAGGRILGLRELEIELRHPDTISDLEQLGEYLAERFELAPEPYGKRSRGMALLRVLAANNEYLARSAQIVQAHAVGSTNPKVTVLHQPDEAPHYRPEYQPG